MKKIMTFAIFVLLTTNGYSQTDRWYVGPLDEIFQAEQSEIDYALAVSPTTLANLARYSDVIGVGSVSGKTYNHFTVTIDHALVGCTNGAVVEVYAFLKGWEDDYPEFMLNTYLPTNLSRIVFAAYTNGYYSGGDKMYWSHAELPLQPDYIREHLSLGYFNRSWWHVDRDDGLLLTQFTNVLQAVRFDRSWTNYFYLCRDGANSSSNRVREDSFRDLRHISVYATEERAQFILDDPLVDPKHKEMILHPGWRYPSEDY
jgi:hypothetical protein